jgi:hypothetical protein
MLRHSAVDAAGQGRDSPPPMPIPAAVPTKKKQRAKRARARQRGRYDLRNRYRERDLPVEHIGIATIEDPFTPAGYLDAEGSLGAEARLAPAQHHDGTVAAGAPGWTPPRRPLMKVFVALRDDPVGRMHSRHQIDEAQYKAARAYQQTADRAMLGAVRSVDLSRTKVSGGLAPDPLTEGRKRSMEPLRTVEERVARHYGSEGLGLTRAVLVERQSVEQTARQRGAKNDREVWFWARLFRWCLGVLAAAFGFATAPYRPRPANGKAELDPGRQAREDELVDPRLRSARANGRG